MGRKAFDTAAEELAHLSKNQAQVTVKHAKRSLTEILKRNPHLWEKFDTEARALGYSASGAWLIQIQKI